MLGPRSRVRCALVALGLLVGLSACTPSMGKDPATWSNRDLAAQLVVAGVQQSGLATANTWARQNLGGIVLHGQPPADLGKDLRSLRAASGDGVPMLVTSDEEGGRVQRLASIIYPLPSARWMGANWSPATIQETARQYGLRMKALGVDTNLAPVADLAIPGYYIASLERGFSDDPTVVAAAVKAWNAGMEAAGVLSVVKHWPGHGQASNTHVGAATTPPLSVLASRDMVPFDAAFAAGAPAVMVGHLDVPGLTDGVPATLSPAAYRYLRGKAGPNTLVMTDSMSMAAVTSVLGQSAPTAAVQALRAGADVVLTDEADPFLTVTAIQRALDAGTYPRARAIASVQRMIAAKRLVGHG